jgi:hypothetical protein
VIAVLAAGPACDEKFQKFLSGASKRQEERDAKKADEAAAKAKKEAAISPAVRKAIDLVRGSDYDFVAVKGDGSRKRYSGFDFAGMLESKSRWLGRGLDDLSTWLDEIGARTFFGARSYLVVLPSGREVPFRAWLEAEMADLPAPLAPPEPAAPAPAAPTKAP